MLSLIKLDSGLYQCPKCRSRYSPMEAFVYGHQMKTFHCECGFHVDFYVNKGTWTEYAFDDGMAYLCSNCHNVSGRFEDVCPECGIQMNSNVIDGGC